MSVAIPGNVKEEEDAEEVGHGEVHHCCRVTDTVGWRTGGCRTARVHRVTGWVRLAMCQKKCVKVRGEGTEQETNTGDCYSG